MKIIEVERDEYDEKNLAKFSNPDDHYYEGIRTKSMMWRWIARLSMQPATVQLILDTTVDIILEKDLELKKVAAAEKQKALREMLKKNFFDHNAALHQEIADLIPQNSSVLDIGAGIGCLKDVLDARGKTVDYHAQDISRRFLELNPAEDDKRYCCDLRVLPAAVGHRRFDVVVDCRASHYLAYDGSRYPEQFLEFAALGKMYIYASAVALPDGMTLAFDAARKITELHVLEDKKKRP